MIRVSVDRHSLRQVQKRLGKMEKKAPAVISAALNDTARTGRVMLTNEARTRYVVKSGASKKNMTIKRATYSFFAGNNNRPGEDNRVVEIQSDGSLQRGERTGS